MMAKMFDEYLVDVQGTIRKVNVADDFARNRDGLLYYWNRAERLHCGAVVIWNARHGDAAPRPEALGFTPGYSFGPLLPPVFAPLAGASIEILLKGICTALKQSVPKIRRLTDIATAVGIHFVADEQIILKALSEHIIWASRYTVPKTAPDLTDALDIFASQHRSSGRLSEWEITERAINLQNYMRVWENLASHFWTAKDATVESAEILPCSSKT